MYFYIFVLIKQASLKAKAVKGSVIERRINFNEENYISVLTYLHALFILSHCVVIFVAVNVNAA